MLLYILRAVKYERPWLKGQRPIIPRILVIVLLENFHSLGLRSFHIKFEFNWRSGF